MVYYSQAMVRDRNNGPTCKNDNLNSCPKHTLSMHGTEKIATDEKGHS